MNNLKPLDHGMLNLPLSKRIGNIDKEIAAFKKSEERRREDALFLKKEKRLDSMEEAKQLYDKMDPKLIKDFCKRKGLKLSEVKLELRTQLKFHPEKSVKLFKLFIKAE